MKICFFVADITFKGGIERVISNLTNSLLVQSKNLEITIVSQYKSFSHPNYKFNPNVKIVYLTDKPYVGAPKSWIRVLNHFKNISNIRKYFKLYSFDVISSQSFPNTLLLWLSGVPLGNVIAVEHVYNGYYGSIIRYIRRILYPKLRAVSVLTSYDKLYYSTWLKSVWLIPNPIDISQTYKSDLDNRRIIAIGRLEKQKNFSGLIDIFAEISPHYPKWELHIYGEGTLKDKLICRIKEKGLDNNVFLEGTTEDIENVIRQSSFLVMSSKYEGFGMVLIEALKNGIPCISYNCPAGPSDIIQNGINGILVEDQNQIKMKAAICKLIEDTDYRKKLGQNAPDSIKKFNSQKIANSWIKYLTEAFES